MKLSTKRTGSLLASVLFFILAFVIYINLVSPELDGLTALRGTLRFKTETLERQQTVNEQVKNLIAKFKSVKSLEETIALAIPPEEDIASLVNQVQAIAKSSGVSLSLIGFRITDATGAGRKATTTLSGVIGYGAIRTTLKVSGTYQAIKSFLRLLETNVRVMDVNSFAFRSLSGSGEGLYGVDITVSSYFQSKIKPVDQ